MKDECKEQEDGPTIEEQKLILQKDQDTAITEFKKIYADKSKKGLQQIKDKYNLLSQQINVDTSALTQAIQKKRIQVADGATDTNAPVRIQVQI